MISLRRLLSKLTVLALSASPAAAATSPAPASDCADCQSADDADPDFDLDDDVPVDLRHIDASDAALVLGRGLAKALSEMKPLAAVHLSTTWALSNDPVRRGAIAVALEWPFPLVPDGLIVEHLSYDPDPTIRAACARAAWVRRTAVGDRGVLARLVEDPDPEVRAIAARAR